jgi:hypothetical protein
MLRSESEVAFASATMGEPTQLERKLADLCLHLIENKESHWGLGYRSQLRRIRISSDNSIVRRHAHDLLPRFHFGHTRDLLGVRKSR